MEQEQQKIWKKEYLVKDKKVSMFLIEDENYSQLKFFVDGEHRYAVSNRIFADLVEGIEHAEKTFQEAFSLLDKKDKPEVSETDLVSKIKSLGFN